MVPLRYFDWSQFSLLDQWNNYLIWGKDKKFLENFQTKSRPRSNSAGCGIPNWKQTIAECENKTAGGNFPEISAMRIPEIMDPLGFPSLENLFKNLPEHLAFNIELKYPAEDSVEQASFFVERNHYLDKVLKVGKETPLYYSQ